jgi:hypothetical protein
MGRGPHVARVEERRSAYWVLVIKPGGKRPYRIRRFSWEYNIEKDIK